MEQLKKPHLQNRPVALAQHGEIIASNYAAQEAGVKKHMPPNKARAILKAVDGVVAYVHVEEGGRISYQPYREASATFFEMLNNLELASVVEKGSIDEAFILCNTGGCALVLSVQDSASVRNPIRLMFTKGMHSCCFHVLDEGCNNNIYAWVLHCSVASLSIGYIKVQLLSQTRQTFICILFVMWQSQLSQIHPSRTVLNQALIMPPVL